MKKGIIIKTTGSWHTVKEGNSVFQCKIKGNYRIKGFSTTNPVAVGDYVDFTINVDDFTGLINYIYPRNNYIIRKASNLSKEAHLLAANIDQAFIIVTLIMPVTSLEFIDRFIVTAEAYHIPTVLIFNKSDIYDTNIKKKLNDSIEIYNRIGYTCIATSAVENLNIDKLKELMKGKITLFSGNSGVGKSTLINALDKNLSLKINDISDYHKSGKHTTTYPEMFETEFGGFIIDTPGIKGFGVIDFEELEVSHFFIEIFKISKNCQFNNCKHDHEPRCAVKEAVKDGLISLSRYKSYLSILNDKNAKYREAY